MRHPAKSNTLGLGQAARPNARVASGRLVIASPGPKLSELGASLLGRTAEFDSTTARTQVEYNILLLCRSYMRGELTIHKTLREAYMDLVVAKHAQDKGK